MNVEPKTTKLLEENWGKAQDVGVRNYISSKAQIVKTQHGTEELDGLMANTKKPLHSGDELENRRKCMP